MKKVSNTDLLNCDFSEIERRIAAQFENTGEWHEGPMFTDPTNELRPRVSPTGRLSYLSQPETQHLANGRRAGVASEPIVNPKEETE